jgi:hypothetical protein
MRLRTMARTSAALYLAPVVVLFGYLYAKDNVLPDLTSGYWPRATSAIATLLFVIVPACAVTGAWEGARHRRLGPTLAGASRSQLVIAWHALWPAFAIGAIGTAVGAAEFLPRGFSAPGHPTFVILLVIAAIVAGYSALGYAMGRLLHPVVSLPLALFGGFWCIAYPPALYPVWVGKLTGGELNDCCAIENVPDWRALLAPVLLAAGMFVAWAAVAVLRHKAGRIGLALSALAVSLGAACLTVHNMGAYADSPRDVSEMTCSGTAPRVCTWPEQKAESSQIRSVVTGGWKHLTAVGVPVPHTVSSSLADTRPDVLPMGSVGDAGPLTDELILRNFGEAVAPHGAPACYQTQAWAGASSQGPLAAWVELTVGLPNREVRTATGSSAVKVAEHVRSYPAMVQRAWYQYNTAQLHVCGTKARLDPNDFVTGSHP